MSYQYYSTTVYNYRYLRFAKTLALAKLQKLCLILAKHCIMRYLDIIIHAELIINTHSIYQSQSVRSYTYIITQPISRSLPHHTHAHTHFHTTPTHSLPHHTHTLTRSCRQTSSRTRLLLVDPRRLCPLRT